MAVPDFVPFFRHFRFFHRCPNVIVVQVDVTHGGVQIGVPGQFHQRERADGLFRTNIDWGIIRGAFEMK